MVTIYHNPRCKKSRAGLAALQYFTSNFEIKYYLDKDPFTIESLTDVMRKLGKEPEEMIRKQEEIFKKEYKGKTFSKSEWIEILVKNPKLVQRPILVKEDKAILGDPVKNVEKLF